MAYKDEYEVARLYTSGDFQKKLEQQFDGDYKLKFHLAPPLLAKKDAQGRLIKQEYGPWVFTAFKWLAKARRFRGTAFDIFGKTEERKMERQLIVDYFATVEGLLGKLDRGNVDLAAEIAVDPGTHPRLRPRQGRAPAQGQGARSRTAEGMGQPAADREGGLTGSVA